MRPIAPPIESAASVRQREQPAGEPVESARRAESAAYDVTTGQSGRVRDWSVESGSAGAPFEFGSAEDVKSAEAASTKTNAAATEAYGASTAAYTAATEAHTEAVAADVAANSAYTEATPADVAPTEAHIAEIPADATPTEVYPVASGPEVAPTDVYPVASRANVVLTEAYSAASRAEVTSTEAYSAATRATVASTQVHTAASPADVAPTEAYVATRADVASTEVYAAATRADVASTQVHTAASPADVAPTEAYAATRADVAPTEAYTVATADVASTDVHASETEQSESPDSSERPRKRSRRGRSAKDEQPTPADRWNAARTPRVETPHTPLLKRPLTKRIGLAVGALAVVGGLVYVADLLLTSGSVPRGTVVAGVDIGGMNPGSADARLRAALESRSTREIPVTIGDMRSTLVPNAAGLDFDWPATWSRIGGQPLNPFTRVLSLLQTHTVPVVSAVDSAALDRQMAALRVHDRPTVEGTVIFQGAKPVAVPPVPGRVLDVDAARKQIVRDWMLGGGLDLPQIAAPMTVRPESVDRAMRDFAVPAVSAPIVFAGKGAEARLDPAQIASILTFIPNGEGGLAPSFKQDIAIGLLAPQLGASEVEPKDAGFSFAAGAAKVVPAVVGDKVNWPKSLEQLPNLIVAQQRTAPAIYEKADPKLTTEAAQGLNITEVMGQFTTGGFSGPSGVNIRTVARKVDGAIIKPGDTFSLNDFTGPRGTAEGYVESGIIDHGRPSTAVGGGISQFATTLYNAAYFAGLEDAGHTEHSYYISRYPAAREATVFDGAIDLRFRNNTPNGIYIETSASDSEITVRLWGVKTVDVESITGEKSKPTEPQTVKLAKGHDCIASEGAPGFTISDTRVISDHRTGREISRHTRTVKYDPIPVVKCE
ncbi:vancomycin resistance protein [Nocardia panacis]|uniref:Vancomycin resistance protein n=2 Tax=Nocardia panacis TaxID=2340916 RepID=A0A3A4KKP3_9NOCA|nr:vancomycin resistance protein [Nocardia panacis]